MEPSFSESRPDLTWENVLEKEYPYFLTYGKEKGAFPRCFTCKTVCEFFEIILQVFTDRKKLRIVVDAPFSPSPTKQPHTSTFTFCFSASCVNRARQESSDKVTFPGSVRLKLILQNFAIQFSYHKE